MGEKRGKYFVLCATLGFFLLIVAFCLAMMYMPFTMAIIQISLLFFGFILLWIALLLAD